MRPRERAEVKDADIAYCVQDRDDAGVERGKPG